MKSLLALLGIPLVAAAPAFADSSLIGTWKATIEGQSYVLTLDAGGGGRLMDQAIQWSAAGDVLQVAANGGVMAYRYLLKGDQLVVSDGGPMSLTLTRVSDETATGAPQGTTSPGGATASTAGAQAATDSILVNGVALTPKQLSTFEQTLSAAPGDSREARASASCQRRSTSAAR
jgi:hypothetical protein